MRSLNTETLAALRARTAGLRTALADGCDPCLLVTCVEDLKVSCPLH